jgi:hypothetical protein
MWSRKSLLLRNAAKRRSASEKCGQENKPYSARGQKGNKEEGRAMQAILPKSCKGADAINMIVMQKFP